MSAVCRVCGLLDRGPFEADGSIIHEHDLCDRAIAECSRPIVVPSGVRTRDIGTWDDERVRSAYARLRASETEA